MSESRRIAVVVSHPIQYYAPLYRALAATDSIALKVLFCSRIGLDNTLDPEMNTRLAWATDLIGGYDSEFLSEADRITTIGFRAVDNPSVGPALARFRPDAVIIHGYAMKTMLRALAWCRLRGVKAVMASDSSSHSAPPGPRRWVKMATAPLLLRQFSAVLTMSDRAEAHLSGLLYPRARMFRTPTMIDDGFWTAREDRAANRARKRAELGLGEDDFVLLAVGKFHPRKRSLHILDALRALNERSRGAKRIRLLLGGDGEERDMLRAYAAEHGLDVAFLGFVNIDALPALYCAADAFVHSAEIEQYGMVALEAAVTGLPMILSDRTGAIGPSSIARAGENALVYPFGDVAALAEAIADLHADEVFRRTMSEASLRISEDHRGAKSVAGVVAACDTGRRRSREPA